jgi:IgGFc binding protein/SprB repeat/CHU_C Type IX secretion signal domain
MVQNIIFRSALWLLIFVAPDSLYAQLDSIHWLPPMHARNEPGPQYIYLSTPEKNPFLIRIRDGLGRLRDTLYISNAAPRRYYIGGSDNTPALVPGDSLQRPLRRAGLTVEGKGQFYANFRIRAFSLRHAADLTCKGRAALGREFRIGHIFQEAANTGRSNFIGIMATADNTVIEISGYQQGTAFRFGNADQLVVSPLKTTLQKGESFVVAQYVSLGMVPNGFMGALVKASQPVAVSCGSWLGAPQGQANDIGIGQIVPVEEVGKEYILCRGNGSSALETPIVVAHTDGTQVWINGGTTPVATLRAGGYVRLGTDRYSNANNMYIRCSHPAYVYQMVGGVPSGPDELRTAGLMFVPPISCAIPNSVDNIYLPNQIDDTNFEGGLMIVAAKGADLAVEIDGQRVFIGGGEPVSGYPEFVTYRALDLFSPARPPQTVRIVAEGAVQVAMYGRSTAAGFAAFYSGFSKTKRPVVALRQTGDGVCPDTLRVSGRFDGLRWFLGDSLLMSGKDTTFITYTPGRYRAVGFLGVCQRTDFAEDSALVAFRSPQFPHTLRDVSCFGYADGHITFGTPTGGKAPYQYSIDNGRTFGDAAIGAKLGVGNYKLVVRDATGCYNRPLSATIRQPDSFYVRLALLSKAKILRRGQRAELAARPNSPVADYKWTPAGANDAYLPFVAQGDSLFRVVVTTANGCQASDSLLVQVAPAIFTPNAIRPDSKDGNGRFTLFSDVALPIISLRIYDRWGELVFERRDFQANDLAAGWDGRQHGQPLLPGIFVYIAEVELAPGLREMLKGDILVVD